MRENQIKYAELLKTAYEKYLQVYLSEELKLGLSYLRYEFDFIHDKDSGVLGNEMIEADLKEVTNPLNEWCHLLHRWYAWNTVLESYKESGQEELEVESEFLNLIIDKCLFAPSRMKDVFINVGIESFHQIRLATDDKYEDKIEKYKYDARIRELNQELIQNHPPRWQKELILKEILSFCNHVEFFDKLERLNDDPYQKQLTKNYRNLSSHSIAPRIMSGTVSTVTRTIIKTTRIEKNEGGSYSEVEIKNSISVAYSYGGTLPLNRNELFNANIEEFKKARNCYNEFKGLLEITISKIPNNSANDNL
jgi:hypothetical protein